MDTLLFAENFRNCATHIFIIVILLCLLGETFIACVFAGILANCLGMQRNFTRAAIYAVILSVILTPVSIANGIIASIFWTQLVNKNSAIALERIDIDKVIVAFILSAFAMEIYFDFFEQPRPQPNRIKLLLSNFVLLLFIPFMVICSTIVVENLIQ